MTSPLRTALLFDDPGELIAALPTLLRFAPTDSAVLVTYTGRRVLSLEAVLRMDLPQPEHVPDAAAQLRTVAVNQAAAVAELVLIGGGPPEPDLPHRALVDELRDTFADAGIVLAHAIWTPDTGDGRTWRCYEDPTCSGPVRPAATSPIKVAATVAGEVTFTSRAELAATITSDPPEALARRAELLATLPAVDPEVELPFIRETLDRIDTGTGTPPDLDDATIARLTHALACPEVREPCLGFAITARAAPAERLWTTLTRASPAPHLANPATLLAICAYVRGDGTLAGIALDAARTANPDHPLATTIRRMLDCGLPPDQFRLMLAHSFVAAVTER